MQKEFKKVSITLWLVFILLVTTACGGKKVASNGEVELNMMSVWVGQDAKAKVFGEMIESFNIEYSGKIKVIIEEQTDYNAYNDKIRTLISTGKAPDLFTLHSTSLVKEYSDSGKLFDFAGYLDTDWINNFQRGVMDNTRTASGGIYALPYESAIFPVFYNKELLAQVGYDHFPTTYKELFELAEALKVEGITPFSQMTGENAFTSQLWYAQAVVAIGGSDVYSKGFENIAFSEAVALVSRMYDYTTKDAIGATAGVSAGHFLAGRTAIFMNGPWFFGRVENESAEGVYENISLAYAPEYINGDGNYSGMITATNAYLTASETEDKNRADAIVSFMKYVTDPVRVGELSEDSGSLFFVKTPVNENASRLQKELLVLADNAAYLAPTYYEETSHAQLTEFPQSLTAVVLGDITPEEFATKIANTD